MRVAVVPAEPEPVWNLRTRWAAEALQKQDKIDLIGLPSRLDIVETVRTRGGRPVVTDIRNLPDLDVIVFARVLSERLVSVISYLRGQGITVVVDLDDDFRHIPPTLIGRDRIDPKLNPGYNWRHFVKAASEASWITCSTPALTYYRPTQATVVPNCIPEHWTNIPSCHRDPGMVGWSGAVGSHPGDLDVTHGGVSRALVDSDARFRVVGNGHGVGKALGLDGHVTDSGMVSHEDYAIALSRLDVGIVPLADSAYTRAKSWITPLSMASVGVWWIASPSPEYAKLYRQLGDEIGPERLSAALCAPRAREWRREVAHALSTPPEARQQLTEAVRAVVRARYTVEGNADRWLGAWQTAHEQR